MPGAAEADDLVVSAPTAKTLSARTVLADPHDGHFTFGSDEIDFTSCSNLASHDLQVYS
jgi:hypothetical protein